MEQPEIAQSSHDDLIHKLHERPQIPLTEWLRVPAHVHYKAFRMADPPTQRPASREEFRRLVESFQMAPNHTVLRETFGYAVKVAANGDRLIVVWQAHTEYYSYQLWHLPGTPGGQLTFGPLTFPDYRFPITPLGTEVCRLDIVLRAEAIPSRDDLHQMLPGPVAYGSRIFDDETTVVTSFTPDEHRRERYLVSVGSTRIDVSHIKNIVDAVVRIETYYHLLLMQKPLFSAAIDSVYTFEQVHLKQREIITGHISHADALALQRWLNSLTQDLLKTNRLAGKLHFELSAAVPYDKIVHATLASMVERPYAPHRPLSDYILSGVTGVADGYQQLLKRIETLSSGFEGMIAIIRTRVDLMLESQNLALLMSVDKTTKSQAILQHTVEGLSVIVIAYYLSGLAGYIFKGLHEMGWMHNPNVASAVFVPVAVGLAFLITTLSRKYLHKKLQSEKPHA